MRLLSSLLVISSGANAEISRERRSHTLAGGTYAGTTYTGSYLRGVTLSIGAADPNPDTGAIRVKVKQTYNWRRDLAGYGAEGCTQFHIDRNKKSNKIGPVDPLNSGKYHRAMSYFQDEKAANLTQMMERWGPQDDWSTRVGDPKSVLDWKINYFVKDFRDSAAFLHDNWCMGDMEDIIEASPKLTNPTSFLFRNRYEGGTNWMVAVADNEIRKGKFSELHSSFAYEKYKFGGAMFDVSPRSDTGAMNNSPQATLPGQFLMRANCKTSLKVAVNDPDGDVVKCRFASQDESSDAVAREFLTYHNDLVTNYPSITLDEATCTVTYDGEKDNVCTGDFNQVFEHKSSRPDVMKYAGANHCHKPFALIVEDFDSDGNVLSSIPITFFGQVVEGPSNGKCENECRSCKALKVADATTVLGRFVTEHKDGGNNLNGRRANRIDIAARFLERFTGKHCGSGLSESSIADFKSLTKGLREAGLSVLQEALDGCKKESLLPKAEKKWEKAVDNLEKLDAKIKMKNSKN